MYSCFVLLITKTNVVGIIQTVRISTSLLFLKGLQGLPGAKGYPGPAVSLLAISFSCLFIKQEHYLRISNLNYYTQKNMTHSALLAVMFLFTEH